MFNPNDGGQRYEIRDATGRTLGFFAPQQVVNELTAECERLRKQVADLQAERDAYLKSLHALLRKEISFTPEELAEMREKGLTLGHVIEQIESPSVL